MRSTLMPVEAASACIGFSHARSQRFGPLDLDGDDPRITAGAPFRRLYDEVDFHPGPVFDNS